MSCMFRRSFICCTVSPAIISQFYRVLRALDKVVIQCYFVPRLNCGFVTRLTWEIGNVNTVNTDANTDFDLGNCLCPHRRSTDTQALLRPRRCNNRHRPHFRNDVRRADSGADNNCSPPLIDQLQSGAGLLRDLRRLIFYI